MVPPSSVSIVFKVDEGPKVKVGTITIKGNKVFTDREIIRSMKNLKPIGIPDSILFENLFAKTFDASKFDEDQERVRDFYQQNGYFTAHVEDHSVTIRDTGGAAAGGFRIPLLKPNKPGKSADISITIDEGMKYKIAKINFTGVKLFKTPNALMRPLYGMGEGDTFSTEKLRKGVKTSRSSTASSATSTPSVSPISTPTPTPAPSTSPSPSMKASSSSSAASIFPATPPPATKSSAANCSSTKAICSILASGKSASSASISSATSSL